MVRIKSFFSVLLLCFVAHLCYLIVSLANAFNDVVLLHFSGMVYVFTILCMFKNRFSTSFLINMYLGYLLSFILLNNLVVGGSYFRTMPWWGVFVIVIALVSDSRRKVYVWTFLFYLAIMAILFNHHNELFENAYLTATLSVFIYSFVVVHYMNQKENLVKKLEGALEEIKTLRGILPICCNCKSIRDDKGLWNRIESYISEHSNAEFTHSYCPDCIRKLYPDIAEEVLAESVAKTE